MTVQTPNPLVQVLPETAPFSEEQRSWLNGFFAGLLSLDNAGVTALSPAENAAVMGEADDGAPWHDPAMAIADRMQLAEGKPLPRKLFAAMAQRIAASAAMSARPIRLRSPRARKAGSISARPAARRLCASSRR